MKANFLFVGLNLNTIVQEKTAETFTFHRWCFENKEHYKYLNVKTRLFSPALIKISGYALGCTAGIYQKIWYLSKYLVFVFDLIYVAIVSSNTFYLSELTKFELLIIIFEHNYVYLRAFLLIWVNMITSSKRKQ